LPVIRSIEENGLDITKIGGHASLLNEFLDRTQEPLPHLSPTAGILHFNQIQNITTIPKKYAVKMNIYLGQCLHAISADDVTLQNAVKYLWKGAGQLLELEQFDLAGEVATILYGILKDSDPAGAIFQYLLVQSALAYRCRRDMLLNEFEPSNRELLFVLEADRLRNQFMNPEISPMYTASLKYFSTIPNGTQLVRLQRTMAQIKAFVAANKNCVILMLDRLPEHSPALTAAVVTLTADKDELQSCPVEIDLDEAAMNYEIFKQIIAPAKAPTAADGVVRVEGSPGKGKGKSKRTSAKAVVAQPPPVEAKASSFAKEALKLNHPEFQKFVADLNAAFEPLQAILGERPPEATTALLFLSSIKTAHVIPLEIVTALSSFKTIYRDFSIMAAMNRKALSSDQPSFGNLN
jgi:hypothetical protein